ncbi:MAG: biopolymer transporter ExbD [Candidatus Sumerlaeia bacterium]
MRRRRSIFTLELNEGVNLTPLLDIIFNLVFFFLLATTLRQHEAALNVELPEAGTVADQPRSGRQTIVINITRANVIIVDGRVMTPLELGDHLARRAASAEQLSVVVRGDGEADYEMMIRVMEACAATGIADVSFQVKKKGRGD